MALLVDDFYKNRDVKEPVAWTTQIVNGASIFAGGFEMVGNRDSLVAASIGRIQPWANVAGAIPAGWANRVNIVPGSQTANGQGALGNTTPGLATQNLVPSIVHDVTERIIDNLAVSGLSGTVSDWYREVYATDDNTFTINRPAAPTIPIGITLPPNATGQGISSTNTTVHFYSAAQLRILAMGGAAHYLLNLGHFEAASIVAGTMKTITMTNHGRLNSVYAAITTSPVAGSANLQLQIAGSPTTGGVVNVAAGNAVGTNQTGTAITGANAFHDGQQLVVNASAVVAFTAGAFDLFADLYTESGL